MTQENIEFNEQQLAAIEQAVAWFKGWQDYQHRKQVFFLAGFAGTGKTTVARTIAKRCAPDHRVVYIAPTGKAASRLRQKGCLTAKTLHQFIYNVRGEDDEGEPIFVAKGTTEENPLLVVMDESSMVGAWDNEALLKHGFPVLALGDTGQVRPVKAAAVYKKGTEDVLLTKIERNAGNIVRASMFVREGKRLPPREYEDFRVRVGKPSDADVIEHCQENGVIIAARNATRQYYNNKARRLLGYKGDLPQVGEKIVCLFNQHGHNFMNGEQAILKGLRELHLEEYEDETPDGMMMASILSLTTNKMKTVKFNPRSFSPDPEVRAEASKSAGAFDYGWALTVHKSQGSEWENVMVIEEAFPHGDYAELMYTGITRAIKRCTLYRA